jgi:hypothetical protein
MSMPNLFEVFRYACVVQMLTKIGVTCQLIGTSEFVRDDTVAYFNSV